MTKIITDEEFLKAYNNEDYLKMMSSCVSSYTLVMSKDEIDSCKMIGMWKALRTYNEDKNTKFSTHLCNMVKYECKTFVSKELDFTTFSLQGDCPLKHNDFELLESVNSLPFPFSKILHQRFFEGMKLREIAEYHGCTIDKIFKQIKTGLKKLQQIYL